MEDWDQTRGFLQRITRRNLTEGPEASADYYGLRLIRGLEGSVQPEGFGHEEADARESDLDVHAETHDGTADLLTVGNAER